MKKKVETRQRHVHCDSGEQIFKYFKKSVEFERVVACSQYWSKSLGTIMKQRSMNLVDFKLCKCKCIVDESQHDCADTKRISIVQLWMCLKRTVTHGAKEHKAAFDACVCSLCSDPLYKKAVVGSFTDFIAYCHCSEKYKEHSDLERSAKVNRYGETYNQAIRRNELYAENIVDNEIQESVRWRVSNRKRQKLEGIKSAVAVPTNNSGVLHLADRKCAFRQCSDCMHLPQYYCELMKGDAILKAKQYRPCQRGQSRTELELITVEMTKSEIVLALQNQLVPFLQHNWCLKWDLHCRNLDDETFTGDTITIKCDFMAVLDVTARQRFEDIY